MRTAWRAQKNAIASAVAKQAMIETCPVPTRFDVMPKFQTLVPLFYMAYDANDEPVDIGVFASRWSEDRPDYPRWPDDPARPVRVLDSVGAAFANLAEDGSWRRESWELVSTPPPDKTLQHMISSSDLTKGR